MQQPSQIKPEKQSTIKNLSQNHDYTEKNEETFPTSTALQNIKNERSFLFDIMYKEVVKSKKKYPVERMREEMLEEERKGKLVSGKEARENTHEDKKMSANGETTKKDIKLVSFHLLETPATIEQNTPRPFLHQRVRTSSSNASAKISSESNQLRDMKAKFGDEAVKGEPNAVEQLDAVYTKSLTRTPHLPQVTKTSSKPQLRAAMPATKPTKTNKGRKKTSKSPKEKKKTSSPTSFPYFKDDYCPPECACYGR